MKILLLGGHGQLGPPLVAELEKDYELRITDVKPVASPHQTMQVDVADYDQVRRAAEGTDAIVNCAVLRHDRKLAFDVNTLGTCNAVRAAAELGHERFINTGPHFTVTGQAYTAYDFDIREEVPPHPGLNLYALSKGLGQEVCRVYSECYPLHVLCMLFISFRAPQPQRPGEGINSFAVTFADAARAIRCGLEVDLGRLPSRNEVFFITTDLPHGQYSNAKSRRLLGFQPQDTLERYWRRPLSG
ncbi:MAG: NAD(P)-dependent oxidoreductase [Candidatus Latescibacterota bacterium]